jgi:hypothetical protein
MQIKNESLPSRCEICHQTDCFDALTNYCSRCQGLSHLAESSDHPNHFERLINYIFNEKFNNRATTFLYQRRHAIAIVTLLLLAPVAVFHNMIKERLLFRQSFNHNHYATPQTELIGNQPSGIKADPLPISEQETYAVYSTVLKDMFIFDKIKLALIEKNTYAISKFEHYEVTPDSFWAWTPEIKTETFTNFKDSNFKVYMLENHFNLKIQYKVLSDQEYDKLQKLQKEFERPQSSQIGYNPLLDRSLSTQLVTFSNIGFDRDFTQCIVFVHYDHGKIGNYVFLEKENGQWQIKKRAMTWPIPFYID